MACNVSQLLDRRADRLKMGGPNGIGSLAFEVAEDAVGVPQIDQGAADDVIRRELWDRCGVHIRRDRLDGSYSSDGRFTRMTRRPKIPPSAVVSQASRPIAPNPRIATDRRARSSVW